MIGRHSAALLCVLLAHAVAIYFLMRLGPSPERSATEPETAPITLFLDPIPTETPVQVPRAVTAAPASAHRSAPTASVPAAESAPAESSAITLPGRVDWPIEGKKSAAKVLAAEAEAARIARMFSGPDGTWASLTPREKSRLKKFQWKPGVDGLEYDEHGNAIYHISDGCVIVNLMFIGCTLGKASVHGDLFNDMRLYFDEQRLPPLNNGNGTRK
jgi:hypothetical protein